MTNRGNAARSGASNERDMRRAGFGTVVAATFALLSSVALGPSSAAAQSAICSDPEAICSGAVSRMCADPDNAATTECVDEIARYQSCLDEAAASCAGDADAAIVPLPNPAPKTRGGVGGALSAPAAPASELTFDAPDDLHLVFLERVMPEAPDAAVYGYLLMGPAVAPDLKAAVARALACRLDVHGAGESAADLGLVALPATGASQGPVAQPSELLELYDFPRARRWIVTASEAAGASLNPDEAVVFVAAHRPISHKLDGEAPFADEDTPYLVVDAGALSERYMRRWLFDVIERVRAGRLQSRSEYQGLMELHSFIEATGAPLAALISLAPAAEASPPELNCI